MIKAEVHWLQRKETGDLADTTFHRHRRILQFITPVKSLIPSVRSPIISAISLILNIIDKINDQPCINGS